MYSLLALGWVPVYSPGVPFEVFTLRATWPDQLQWKLAFIHVNLTCGCSPQLASGQEKNMVKSPQLVRASLQPLEKYLHAAGVRTLSHFSSLVFWILLFSLSTCLKTSAMKVKQNHPRFPKQTTELRWNYLTVLFRRWLKETEPQGPGVSWERANDKTRRAPAISPGVLAI